jgi:hypothetical protein
VQKPNFSVAEAFAAGVDLIERSFKSVLIWALAMFLLALVPAFVAFVAQGGHFIVPDGGFKLSGVTGLDSGLVMEQRRQMLGVNLAYGLFGLIWAVVGAAVIYAAIYRTAWARKALPSGGLRLGAAEGWLTLVMVVQALGLIILILAVWSVLLAVALAAAIIGPPLSGWALAIGGLAVIAVALWVTLRLCLCQAMTVADSRFRFFESWALTRGRSWKLFWTFSLVLALIIGLEVLYLGMVVLGIVVTFGVTTASLRTVQLVPIPGFAVPIGLLWLAFASLLGALLRAVLVAPLASAYRGLSGGGSN